MNFYDSRQTAEGGREHGADQVFDVVLKAFTDDGGECYRSPVIKKCWFVLLGTSTPVDFLKPEGIKRHI